MRPLEPGYVSLKVFLRSAMLANPESPFQNGLTHDIPSIIALESVRVDGML